LTESIGIVSQHTQTKACIIGIR